MKRADLGLNLTAKRARKREFLAQMERVVPWVALVALVALVAPHAPESKKGSLAPSDDRVLCHFGRCGRRRRL